MSPYDFCTWLQGFFELQAAAEPGAEFNHLSAPQVKMIKTKLNSISNFGPQTMGHPQRPLTGIQVPIPKSAWEDEVTKDIPNFPPIPPKK